MNLTEKTLLEQLGITEREIERRKQLFDIGPRDAEILASCKKVILGHVEAIVQEFYDRQITHPEVAVLIGDRDTLVKLHGALTRYVVELFSGVYDSDYVHSRLIVGRVHKRIGVTPKLYMAALRLLFSILGRVIDTHVARDGNCVSCKDIHESLDKLLLFDTQLVFDTYIASLMMEVESARAEAEAHAARLEREVDERTEQLRQQSLRDPLTKLYNQRAFHDCLRRETAMAERYGKQLALLYMDLNGFKQVNDGDGHQVGDALLVAVAETIRSTIRRSDMGFRYGGDEFCILLPDAAGSGEALARRLCEAFDAGITRGVSFAIGIAETDGERFFDPDALVRAADRAMYVAKARAHAQGGHAIEVADPAALSEAAD